MSYELELFFLRNIHVRMLLKRLGGAGMGCLIGIAPTNQKYWYFHGGFCNFSSNQRNVFCIKIFCINIHPHPHSTALIYSICPFTWNSWLQRCLRNISLIKFWDWGSFLTAECFSSHSGWHQQRQQIERSSKQASPWVIFPVVLTWYIYLKLLIFNYSFWEASRYTKLWNNSLRRRKERASSHNTTRCRSFINLLWAFSLTTRLCFV